MFTFNTSFISISNDTVSEFWILLLELNRTNVKTEGFNTNSNNNPHYLLPASTTPQLLSICFHKTRFFIFFFFLPILWNVQSSIICGSIYNNTSADQINKKGIESKGNREIKQNEILQHENEIVNLLLRDRYFGYLINFVLPSLFRRALP